jgi:hypothetical protein
MHAVYRYNHILRWQTTCLNPGKSKFSDLGLFPRTTVRAMLRRQCMLPADLPPPKNNGSLAPCLIDNKNTFNSHLLTHPLQHSADCQLSNPLVDPLFVACLWELLLLLLLLLCTCAVFQRVDAQCSRARAQIKWLVCTSSDRRSKNK